MNYLGCLFVWLMFYFEGILHLWDSHSFEDTKLDTGMK